MFQEDSRVGFPASRTGKPVPDGAAGRCDEMPRNQRILVIEDDPIFAGVLQNHLSRVGFDVTLSADGREVLPLLCRRQFDLLLMDILLPGGNGLEILSLLRATHKTPVILMSALGSEHDRIAGFLQGADDYLPKPFSMAELEVRIAAVLRRVAYERDAAQHPPHGDAHLHCDERRQDVRCGERWAELTPTEYRLLAILLRSKEEVLSKAFLYQQVLHRPYTQYDRVLDMHVSHLRRKLQAIGYVDRSIDAVWGKGYVLKKAR
ncbi:response regulator transcription factor [Brenneria goodwinii]|uniref:Two-component response regulator PfeR, enterobactin n=2 Tax=Brenneria goodwinii TaxID=1109412 RepID=A0A0G4JSB6_9GAMM|nr:response regulator transcription factor [Brenneria goodwinii]MCG8156459.1 response regulator transcription factor [Brenneria goodwinii]MCG8162170.1 response regulator transcription factor [Brenneria goodwinii]MCG8166788.1 response regulator transcription factor [Brenneria goodwinii]MCG8171438.1 response regulator transcription factor [Brenneria goodwinii]MCG8175140.1 response regulator transcription factor [Brenneria goodwinii]